LVESHEFDGNGVGLNGIAFHADGYLLVVKKSDGNLYRIPLADPASFAAVRLPRPLRAADGVLVVSAEYNWSIPGGLKNAIDWLSRYKDVSFKDKPCCIQSAAPGLLGGSRMQYHLRMALQAIDAQLFGKPEVIVNMAASKFADGKLTDQAAIDLIKQQLAAFGKFIDRVKMR
jgi:chromate reductase